jgi:hypothetical protein
VSVEYPLVIGRVEGSPVRLPSMREVRQTFRGLPAADAAALLAQQWASVDDRVGALPNGAAIAVAVGSRGIADIVPVVRAVVDHLKAAGCRPFIVPAMGSHGGATAEGQVEVLRTLGVTEEAMRAPVRATMEVVSPGDADGHPLYLDSLAWEADGIVLVNRVKPHTDFVGPVESGLMKMLVIGLGKQVGADYYHRLGVVRGLEVTIPAAARALLERTRVLFGVAIVENEEHQTALVRVVPAEAIEATEIELLKVARAHLPGLPVDDIDLLIVDEMGKEISGAGLDPNVIGRSSAAWSPKRERPRVSRIFVAELTAASEGNAAGLGVVDAVSASFLDRIDIAATAVNAFTSCCPEDARIPAVFRTARDAVLSLLTTVRPSVPEDLRIVYIRNTMALDPIWVSVGCLDQIDESKAAVSPAARELKFDRAGRLVSPFLISPMRPAG